jgi:surface antigen
MMKYLITMMVAVGILLTPAVARAESPAVVAVDSHNINQDLIRKLDKRKMDAYNKEQARLRAIEKAKEEARLKAIAKAKAEAEAKRLADLEALRQAEALKAEQDAVLAREQAVVPSIQATGAVEGNTYAYGWCTWYVKNRRPDIPNSWGNAYEWYWRAQSMGWATGTTPRPGAIGAAVNYGHVVIVESVNGDGSVNISEMNAVGWNRISGRTTPASEFVYIY